jgi:hypothetical protein
MSNFNDLLDGKYPEHLGQSLWDLPADDRLAAVRQRIAAIDSSPADQLPFERRILAAIEKDLRAVPSRKFILHNRDVFELVAAIFANLTELDAHATGISKGTDASLERKLRLAAFLHDTGKALEQSRHPILGWHVLLDLASVGTSDKEAKQVLLSNLTIINASRPEAEYRWVARLIRDHDKFGVISTGEASYVILSSLLHYGRTDAATSLAQLRDTWLLNLADIGGTLPAQPAQSELPRLPKLLQTLKLRQDKFNALTADWKVVYETTSGKTFSSALEGLRQASETPEFTVTRIRRLLLERSAVWGALAGYFTEDLVQEALETHFAPRDLLSFCRELGMVAKLDYALQFWNELADYLYIKDVIDGDVSQMVAGELTKKQNTQRTGGTIPADWMLAYLDYNSHRDHSPWIGLIAELIARPSGDRIRTLLVDRARQAAKEEQIARKQADLLIAILRRVVVAYHGLIRGTNISETAAIGVGFSYFKSDDREKKLALYELLTGGGDGRERGLRWLIDEIASWDMLA